MPSQWTFSNIFFQAIKINLLLGILHSQKKKKVQKFCCFHTTYWWQLLLKDYQGKTLQTSWHMKIHNSFPNWFAQVHLYAKITDFIFWFYTTSEIPVSAVINDLGYLWLRICWSHMDYYLNDLILKTCSSDFLFLNMLNNSHIQF